MKHLLTIAIVWALPFTLWAQPVEEEIQFETPIYEIEVIESPQDIQRSSQIAPLGATPGPVLNQLEPIGEVAKPGVIEQDSGPSSWNFSPSLGIKALGYNANEKEPYGEIAPGASLSTDFLTGSGKKVGFNVGYTFMWQEFYDKSQGTARYFEHDSSLGLNMPINDTLSVALNLGFNYSVRANPNDREFTIFSGDSLKFTAKATEQLSFNFGYGVDFFNFPDGATFGSSVGIPSDVDDVRQGDLTFDDAVFGGMFDSGDVQLESSTWYANNKAMLGTSYAIPKGPKLSLGYDYVFATLTNADSTDWKGHFVTFGLSQSAWEGGSISISNQLRLQNFQTATIPTGEFKTAQRNRTNISISQKVTDQFSLTAWYRLQMTNSNAVNEWTPLHFWFLQANFSF